MKVILQNGQFQSSLSSAEMMLDQNTLTITPKRNSDIVLYITNQSPAFSQQNIIVNFLEPHASVSIFGLYQLEQSQSLQIHTVMNHHVPHCVSKQLWKGILSDESKADFEGKIVVDHDAQKTVAHLTNKNLLLSDTTEIKTKPFLEIYADDVQCSHGATVGCLDPNAIFYLRSRGISENEAKALLIEAFIEEVIGNT